MSGIESLFPDQIDQNLPAITPAKKNELGQDEFLKLMLAQLKHQDPSKPLENGEFVAQMAQFSTVAGIENMEKSMNEMSQSYAANQLMQSSSLIGRTALVPGTTATLGTESNIDAYYKLEEATSGISFDVYSASGEIVHHSDQAAKSAGLHPLQWDGMLANGNRAPAGQYTLTLTHGEEGDKNQAAILIENKISTVSLTPGGNSVTFETEEGNSVSLQDIEKLQ
ncbi:MAG: hypothetical protein KTR32_08535 [Granulosicoccus sp.]|nr:hypothetical protein [Granulosicoccus sp.]